MRDDGTKRSAVREHLLVPPVPACRIERPACSGAKRVVCPGKEPWRRGLAACSPPTSAWRLQRPQHGTGPHRDRRARRTADHHRRKFAGRGHCAKLFRGDLEDVHLPRSQLGASCEQADRARPRRKARRSGPTAENILQALWPPAWCGRRLVNKEPMPNDRRNPRCSGSSSIKPTRYTVGNRLMDDAAAARVQASMDRSNAITSGHRACQGCGEALGARYALDAAMRASGGSPGGR